MAIATTGRAFLVVAVMLVVLGTRRGAARAAVPADPAWPGRHNVEWATPSLDAAAPELSSMPLGNGDVSSNVWMDGTSGVLRFYLSSAAAWDENSQLYKIARLNVATTPRLWAGAPAPYLQTHNLTAGAVDITTGAFRVRAFVDAQSPSLQVLVEAAGAGATFTARAWIDVLRTAVVPEVAGSFCDKRFAYPDTVVAGGLNVPTQQQHTAGAGSGAVPAAAAAAAATALEGVAVYHRNDAARSTFWADVLALQGLGAFRSTLKDPLTNRTFGTVLFAEGMHRVNDTTLVTSAPTGSLRLQAVVRTQQSTADAWQTAITADATATAARSWADVERGQEAWWAAFWARSFVNVTGSSGGSAADAQSARQATGHYLWQRFLDAADGRSSTTPIKFNGQAFVVDNGHGPDYRAWGGGYWFQNTRQPYYNTLAAGDLDILRGLYGMYTDALPLARARTKTYFNHSGAFFPETMTIFGSYDQSGWGWGCSAHPKNWLPSNTYIRYHWEGSLELVLILLDDWAFTHNETVARNHLIPIADAVTTFYREHFPEINATTKRTRMYPAQSLETWQCKPNPPTVDECVTDPAPDVAGLHAVLPRLLALPTTLTTAAQRDAWTSQLSLLPDLPTGNHGKNGSSVLLPGAILPPSTSNTENTQLYPVHPYRLFGVGKPDVALALATYAVRPFPCNDGWCQDVLDAAMLGLADDAKSMVAQRAAQGPAKGWRWPGYAQHYQDYEPSADHFSFMRTAMHYMLLAPLDDTAQRMTVFPAWATGWDVAFKLHAPLRTTVEAACKGGKLQYLHVTPASRLSDFVLGPGCSR